MNHEIIGRKDEIRHLSTNFIFQTNTILLAPQGWGKTSIIRMASADAAFKDKKFRFCHVLLSNTRDEERFYELLSEGVIKAVSSSLEDALRNISRFFSEIVPKMTFASATVEGIRLSFDWSELRKKKNHILDLPYRVAKEDGLKIVVCLDDFHEVGGYQSAEEFTTLLTERWRGHAGVSYCLCASELPIMKSVMKSPVFSRFGEIIRLGKVQTNDFASFLKDSFAESGKYLDMENAMLMISMAEGHPFYVRRLADISLAMTSVVCSKEVIEEAHRAVSDQMHLAFTQITASLTSQQLCYLHAILAGETVISTSEVLHRHRISSATSASRSKAALLDKGLISVMEGKMVVTDPFYAYWLNNVFFDR